MSTETVLPCTQLPIIPLRGDEISSITVYRRPNAHQCIFVTFGMSGVYEFDCNNLNWSRVTHLFDSHSGVVVSGHAGAVDQEQERGKLHLFGGPNPFYAILNLETKNAYIRSMQYVRMQEIDDGYMEFESERTENYSI